jgi:hypothetical protein
MEKKIQKLISTPMSDSDIAPYLPAMLLREFTGKLPAIILYEFEPYSGHWSLLFNTIDEQGQKTCEFFDSYGLMPDQVLKVVHKEYNPHVVKWLLKNAKNIAYNDHKYQASGGDVQTCGRHCVNRYNYRHFSSDQYYSKMKNAKKVTGLSYDEIVCLLVGGDAPPL